MTRLTPLISLLEWTLVLILSYMEWAGDDVPRHIVTIASAAWIIIALLCSTFLAVSIVLDQRLNADGRGKQDVLFSDRQAGARL